MKECLSGLSRISRHVSCMARALCTCSGISSAQTASASKRQAFSFGFAVKGDSGAPEDAPAQNPGDASIAQAASSAPEEPQAAVKAAAQPQEPPAQQSQVSIQSMKLNMHVHQACVAP